MSRRDPKKDDLHSSAAREPLKALSNPAPAPPTNPSNKTIVLEFLSTKLNESQHTSRSHKRLLHEMKLFYYKEASQKNALAHQKFCASILWRIMLVPFMRDRSKNVDRIIKFFTKFVLSTGTVEDLEEYKFPLKNLPPLYSHILEFVKQCHGEIRYNVRMRMMELVKSALEKFSEEIGPDSPHYNAILDILYQRVKDKMGSVRTIATQCMKYFRHNRNIRKVLLEHGECDPNIEVRRQAVIVLGESQSSKTKLDHICSCVFDTSEIVRVEAFIALSKIPLGKIPSKDEREKLVYWGLTQPSVRVQNKVKKYLLPAWYQNCNKNLVHLLKKINPHGRNQVARVIINGLFRSDDDITGEDIDRSFLNEENVIPLHELTSTNSQIWYLLCEAFREIPDCFAKVAPNLGALCKLMKELLQAIRGSEEPEEQMTGMPPLSACLLQLLRIAKLVPDEEGSRQQLVKILKHILHEPKIRSCAVILETVRLLFLKETKREEIQQLIETTLRSIFEMVEVSQRSSALDELSRAVSRRVSILNPSLSHASTNGDPGSPSVGRNSSMRELKEELASVRLHRHKLISLKELVQKELLVNEEAFVKEKLIETEEQLATVQTREDELKELLATKTAVKSSSDNHQRSPETSRQDVNQNYNLVASPSVQKGEGARVQFVVDEDEGDIEMIENDESPRSLTDSNILRGLIILTGYLRCGGSITNYIKDEYINFLLYYLHMEDFLIRKYVIYVNCFIGLSDKSTKPEVRQSMNVCLAALRRDPHECIRHVAFKCVVDLFTHHGAEHFLPGLEEVDICDMESPLNSPVATAEEVTDSFLQTLSSAFLEREPNLYDKTLKVKAYVKLFLSNRLTNQRVLEELLSTYADPTGGTTNAACIGCFVPLYISQSLENAVRVIHAFVSCLHEIYTAREDSTERFEHVDPTCFINFIVENTSSEVLQALDKSETLHEMLALKILRDIRRDVSRTYNVEMGKILKNLSIVTEERAEEIKVCVDEILDLIVNVPHFTEVSRLKTLLRKYVRKLDEKFQLEPPHLEVSHAVAGFEGMEL